MALSRLLVEMWPQRMLPVRAQKEVKTVLLETGGREILLCSGRKLCTIVISYTGKAELVRDEPCYSAKVISKQSAEDTARFIPVACRKM